MSIRQNVILWFLFLAGLIVGAFGFMVYQGVSQEVVNSARRVAVERADVLSSNIDWEKPAATRFDALATYFDELSAISNLRSIAIRSWPDMNVLHERGKAGWMSSVDSQDLHGELARYQDWFAEVVVEDELPCSLMGAFYGSQEGVPRSFVVITATDRRALDGSLRDLRNKILQRCAWALVLSLLAACIMGQMIAAPLRRLAASVVQIKAGEKASIELSSTFSELSYLRDVLADCFEKIHVAFERQTRFTADASHELRTPVTTARAVTDVALLSPRSPEEYVGALGKIRHSLEQMTDIIDSLLMLGGTDAGQVVLHTEELTLTSIALQAQSMLQADVDEREARVVLESSGETEAVVRGDRKLLTLLLRNLISNAIRYGPTGGVVRIDISPSLTGWEVVVQDSGPGIPLEQRAVVFNRFARGDDHRSRDTGGVGLGLSIVSEIATLHGLELSIGDTQGGGAAVRVSFPS